MHILNNLTKKEKYFAITFLLGFLVKFNYLLLRIFNVPSTVGLILKNLVLVLVIICFLFPLVKEKKGRYLLLTILALFSLLFIANVWYNKYFGNYLSLNDITMGQGVRPFKVLFRQIISIWEIIFVLDLVGLIYLLNKDISKKSGFSNKSFQLFKQNKKICRIVIFIIIILLPMQIFITNTLLGNNNPVKLYNKSASGFVNVYGLAPLYFYESYLAIAAKKSNTIEADTNSLESEDKDEIKKISKQDMNIIVIQVESLDEKLIDYEYNNQQVTPFLNQLKDESLYFNNFYSQHVNGSFDADFSFLTSLYPVNKNYVFRENDMTKFNSFASVLNTAGYETLAFHGNDKRFFHRHKAFPDLGFDKFYSKDDFSNEEKIMDVEESYLGINDYDFFNQSLDYLEKAKNPFFAYMITVTSHTPFDFYPSDEVKKEFADIESSLVADYFQSISFVDKSLELFFAELEKRGLTENTLFVIYGDHEAGINEEEYSSGKNFSTSENIKEPENVPLLIKAPNHKSDTIEKTGTIADVAPTILDLMKIEEKPEEFAGSSLLDGKEVPVPFIHEQPQVLYKDDLFIRKLDDSDGTNKARHFTNLENEEVELPQEKEDKVFKTIDRMREIIFERATKDDEE
ncbi:MAG: LTA synthase family protein [Halanaerobacter sp.]